MRTIGLTGNIASGKSATAHILASLGARILDSDAVAKDVYQPGEPGFDAVVAAFGPAVVAPDGAINRVALGKLVFDDPTRLKRLTDIVWPLTRRKVEQAKAEAQRDGVEVFVIEAPLLIEAGWRDLVDEVWLVRTPREVARERLVRERGLSEADEDARLAAQPPDDARLAYADLVIENNSDLAALESVVRKAWETALTRARE